MPHQQRTFTCTHTTSGGPVICGRCASVLLRRVRAGDVSLSPQQVQYLQRVHDAMLRYDAMIQEGQADVAALRGQMLQPEEVYGDNRTVASSLIGNMSPNQLPASYPYAIDLELNEEPVPPEDDPGASVRDMRMGGLELRQQQPAVDQECSMNGGRSPPNGSRSNPHLEFRRRLPSVAHQWPSQQYHQRRTSASTSQPLVSEDGIHEARMREMLERRWMMARLQMMNGEGDEEGEENRSDDDGL